MKAASAASIKSARRRLPLLFSLIALTLWMVLIAVVTLLEPSGDYELLTARVAVIAVQSAIYSVKVSFSFEHLAAFTL